MDAKHVEELSIYLLDAGSIPAASIFTMRDLKKLSTSLENEELFLNTIKYLSDVIDAKDEYTIGHSERVQRYSVLIGKRMGLSKKILMFYTLLQFYMILEK